MTDRNDPNNPLSPDDARLLDALVECNFDRNALEGLNASDRARVDALMATFGLLEDYPVADAEEVLVHATLARVWRARSRRTLEPASDRTGWRFRVPDVLSMAALVLIGVSVAWPILGAVRARSIDARCVANLRALGTGFSMYANEHEGRVPIAMAGFGSGSAAAFWIDPVPVAQAGYCEHGHLNCPGHDHGMGYSRQVLPGHARVAWLTGPSRAVMGDRNPVIDARENAVFADPFTNSGNHRGRGQNVLMLDGSTPWLDKPLVDADDNIWLIRGRSSYEPGAVPESERDTFLAH